MDNTMNAQRPSGLLYHVLVAGLVFLLAGCAAASATTQIQHRLGQTGPGGGVIWYARHGVYLEAAFLPGGAGFDDAAMLASAWQGGGLSDWRSPTKGELLMLAEYYKKKSVGTVSGRYWSGSVDGTRESRFVWFVDFGNGLAYHNSAQGRQAGHGVIAVRQWIEADGGAGRSDTSGAPGPAGGVIVVSKATACLEVSPLLGHAGWDGAARLAGNYTGGGASDWRLPTRAEMQAVYEHFVRHGLGAIGPDRYWTAQPSAAGEAWFVDFSDGKHYATGYGGRDSLRPVRAVRGRLP